MSIKLTRIYTRHGDGGETHLGDMSRVSKLDPRIAAFGDVDELNASIGVAVALGQAPASRSAWLERIQNELFDVGADLSVPFAPDEAEERLRIDAGYVDWLEAACDEVNRDLDPLNSFVLPGGTALAAQLHVCRTVCRRAERSALAVDDRNPQIASYLNRLSDLLFLLSREANRGSEPLWVPGASRG